MLIAQEVAQAEQQAQNEREQHLLTGERLRVNLGQLEAAAAPNLVNVAPDAHALAKDRKRQSMDAQIYGS